MSNHLLIDEPPLVVLRSLAKMLGGDSDRAIFVQQVHYLVVQAKKDGNEADYHDGCWWTHKSIDEWLSIFDYWSPRKIERIISYVEQKGFIRSEFLGKGGSGRKKSFTVNINHFTKYVYPLRQSDGLHPVTLTESQSLLNSKNLSLESAQAIPQSVAGLSEDEAAAEGSRFSRRDSVLASGTAAEVFAILRIEIHPDLGEPDISRAWVLELREKMKRRGRPQYLEDCRAYFASKDPWATERDYDVATFCREPADRWYRKKAPVNTNGKGPAAGAAPASDTLQDLAAQSAERIRSQKGGKKP